MGHSIKERVSKSIFWMVWSRGGLQLISGVSSILIARWWLEPSDYGLMAIVGIWTTTIGMIAEMGLGAAIIQFQDLVEEEINACFWLIFGIGVTGYFALFLAAPFIAEWFGNPLLSDLLRVAGLTLPLISFAVVPDSLLRKRLALDKISKIQLVAAMSAVITVFALASQGAGVWALVAGTLVTHSVANIGLYWMQSWWPGLQVGSKRLSKIVEFSLSRLGNRFFWSIYNQADLVVLGKITNEGTLGFYAYAKEWAMFPVVKGSTVVNSLAAPLMAELQNDMEAMSETFKRGLRIISCSFSPICVGIALVAHDVVMVFLTEKWLSIVPMLQILSLYAALKSIDVLFPPLLSARFRHKFILYYTIVLFVVMTLAFWGGALWNGAMGVVLVWVSVYPLMMMRLLREVLKEISMTYTSFWRQIGPAVKACLIMAMVVVMVQSLFFSTENFNPLIRLLVTSGIGAVTYLGVLFVQGGKQVDELMQILRWIFVPKSVASMNK